MTPGVKSFRKQGSQPSGWLSSVISTWEMEDFRVRLCLQSRDREGMEKGEKEEEEGEEKEEKKRESQGPKGSFTESVGLLVGAAWQSGNELLLQDRGMCMGFKSAAIFSFALYGQGRNEGYSRGRAPRGSSPGAFPTPSPSHARAEELNLPSKQGWEERAAGWRWEWQGLQRRCWATCFRIVSFNL